MIRWVGIGGISMYALRVSGDLWFMPLPNPGPLLLLPASAAPESHPALSLIQVLKGLITCAAACGTSDRDEVSNHEFLGEHILHIICTASECAGTCQWPRRLPAEMGAINPFSLSKVPCSQPMGPRIASQSTLYLSSKAPCVSSLGPGQVLASFGAGQGRGIKLRRCLEIFLVSACKLLVFFFQLL